MQDSVVDAPKAKGGSFKVFLFVFLAFIVAVGATAFAITKYPQVLGLSKGQALAQAEVDSLVMDVEKLLALPSDEKPTVATITDVEKLKEQVFFKNALNGDKVLIYTKNRKAILYRPTENKIVEVGAVNINQQPKNGTNLTPATPVVPIPTPVVTN